MSQLEMAMCLKSTGMPLKDIKRYFELVDAGDDTLDERLKIFTDHREPTCWRKSACCSGTCAKSRGRSNGIPGLLKSGRRSSINRLGKR